MDRATPNLPAGDFDRTERFYVALGFETRWRDGDWMILARGSIVLEFFAYPEVDPLASSFSCCLRLDDLDGFYVACLHAGLVEAETGQPRLHPPRTEGWGGRVAALINPNGTLLRLIQN